MNILRPTLRWKSLILPRLVAALPLIGFGLLHFLYPEKFRSLMQVSGFPFVEINMILAPAAEILGGVLLLFGLFGRIGGVLGVATMVPAVLATLAVRGMTPQTLPEGVPPEVLQIPPLPIPIVVLACSLLIALVGSGRYSIDDALTRPKT
jgi:uncharacterized membrane protein YphA (DoxX/SURF4 family)